MKLFAVSFLVIMYLNVNCQQYQSIKDSVTVEDSIVRKIVNKKYFDTTFFKITVLDSKDIRITNAFGNTVGAYLFIDNKWKFYKVSY